MSLYISAGSPETLLLLNVVRTKTSCAGSIKSLEKIHSIKKVIPYKKAILFMGTVVSLLNEAFHLKPMLTKGKE